MTAEYLALAQAEVNAHVAATKHVTALRDRAFQQAREEGWTLDQIAEATGLSKQRVSQIGSAR